MLLCFLLELRRREALDFKITCVHVNHGIREIETERDEEFCISICKAFDTELIVEKHSVPALAQANGEGIEEAARNLRYSIFSGIIRGRNDISAIAVAHNMNDNAETVLFNILRGSGANGAGGIRPVRDNIIRPLISVLKNDILAALAFAGIPYVIDSTNNSTDYTRNYLRHEIMPRLKRITDNPEAMIYRFSENMRSDEEYIKNSAYQLLDGESTISISALRKTDYSLFYRVISIMAERLGLSVSAQIASDIFSILDKDNFSYSLIGGGRFVAEHGLCRVEKGALQSTEYFFPIKEGKNDLSPYGAEFIISTESVEKSYSNVYKIAIQANLSSAIISGSLYLRPKRDGDTVFYGGMTHKLKKLFSDLKIPPSKRSRIPVLCDDNGVVWVPGFGVRDDGAQSADAKPVFATLCILMDADEEKRLISASEYRT